MTKCGLGSIHRATGSFLSCQLRLLTGCQERAAKQGCPRVTPSTHKHHLPALEIRISCKSHTSNYVKCQDWAKRMLYLAPMCCLFTIQEGREMLSCGRLCEIQETCLAFVGWASSAAPGGDPHPCPPQRLKTKAWPHTKCWLTASLNLPQESSPQLKGRQAPTLDL